MRSMFFILSLCFCGTLSAHERDSGTSLEVLVGASLGYRTIEISERESVMEVAEFQTDGLNVSPSISLRTEPKYIWQDRNWSYTFSADFFTSKFDKQVVGDGGGYNRVIKNKGTKIEGLSLYFTPIIYYQFGREKPEGWQYRVGVGAGLGYQDHNGEFLITNREHPNYGKVRKINHSKLGLSTGIYAEAKYKKHHIVFNGDLITNELSGDDYRYVENHVSITYRYQIYSFSLDF